MEWLSSWPAGHRVPRILKMERERDIVKCLAFNHFYIFKLHILYLCIVHVHAQKDKGEFW